MRVLIIEDEPVIADRIRKVLEEQLYTVDIAMDGEEGIRRIYIDPYDVILLDIMLPKIDGLGVLNEIRREKLTTPVLMLTALGEVEDRIKGLDLGADDYLAKPFSTDELLARIRALLRRKQGSGSPLLTVGDIRVNPATREAFAGSTSLQLTAREFSILEFLLYNKNRAITRFSMAEHIWGDEFDPFVMSNNIDVHIKNLRQKIGSPANQVIKTIRGTGYMIKGR